MDFGHIACAAHLKDKRPARLKGIGSAAENREPGAGVPQNPMQCGVGEDLGVFPGLKQSGGQVFEIAAVLHVPIEVGDRAVRVPRSLDQIGGGVIAGDGGAVLLDLRGQDAVAAA